MSGSDILEQDRAGERDRPGETLPEPSPKRRAVVDAAEALFLELGYGAVSMDAVARTASVSKATLYAYFTSKDQLFATIVAERGLNHCLDATTFPAQVTDLRATLRSVGEKMVRFMLRPGALAIYRVAIAESLRFPELGRAFFENGPDRTRQRLTAWLELQQRAGHVVVPDPDLAAHQLLALLKSSSFMRATLGLEPGLSDAEIEHTVAAAVDTWLLAFGRERQSPPA